MKNRANRAFLLLLLPFRLIAMEDPQKEIVIHERVDKYKFSPYGQILTQTIISKGYGMSPEHRTSLYATSSGALIKKFTQNASHVKWSPKGAYIGLQEDNAVHIVTPDGEAVDTIHSGGRIQKFRFSADERLVSLQFDDPYIACIDVYNLMYRDKFSIGHTQEPYDRIGPVDPQDEHICATNSEMSSFFDSKEFNKLGTISGKARCYSEDGRLIATSHKTKGISPVFWFTIFNRRFEQLYHYDNSLTSTHISMSPDNNFFCLYSLNSWGEEQWCFNSKPSRSPYANRKYLQTSDGPCRTSEIFSSLDGKRILSLTDGYGKFFLDITPMEKSNDTTIKSQLITLPLFQESRDVILYFTQDPRIILLGNRYSVRYIVNLETGQAIPTYYQWTHPQDDNYEVNKKKYKRKASPFVSENGTYLKHNGDIKNPTSTICTIDWKQTESTSHDEDWVFLPFS